MPAIPQPDRYNQAIRYFLYGQLGFLLGLAVCVALLPSGLGMNRGFSYYGDVPLTLLPYSLAFLAIAIFTLLASYALPDAAPFRVIKIVFRCTMPLLFLIVLSTLSLDPLVIQIHITCGVTLFILQVLFATWLAFLVCRGWRNALLYVLLFAGGLVSLLSLSHVITYLIHGQVVFQLAFGGLVLNTLAQLRPRG